MHLRPLGDFRQRLLRGKVVQQARVSAASKLCTAVYWMLAIDCTFKEVEPYWLTRGRRAQPPS